MSVVSHYKFCQILSICDNGLHFVIIVVNMAGVDVDWDYFSDEEKWFQVQDSPVKAWDNDGFVQNSSKIAEDS